MDYETILIFSSIITVGICICVYLILHSNGNLKMLGHIQNKFNIVIACITTFFFVVSVEFFVFMVSLAILG